VGKQEHWKIVYQTKDYTKVGWYQPSSDFSLELLERIGISNEASVIDIGAGASTLVDGLISRGFRNITLLDISKEAFDIVRERLAEDNNIPNYRVEDIAVALSPRRYDLWHDRAAFHFLQEEREVQGYVQNMYDSLSAEGHAIIGTFAIDGPDSCSALPVQQYNIERMQRVLGERFSIVESAENIHTTPGGSEQKFIFFIIKPIQSIYGVNE
jgi:SAM-dependent methyltransferase